MDVLLYYIVWMSCLSDRVAVLLNQIGQRVDALYQIVWMSCFMRSCGCVAVSDSVDVLLYQIVLDQQLKRKPQGKGPLAEIDFWRDRNGCLGSLVEQLKLPKVGLTTQVMSSSHHITSDASVLSAST